MKGCLKIFIFVLIAIPLIGILATISPLLLLAGLIGSWYFSQRKPNQKRKKIAAGISLVGLIGSVILTFALLDNNSSTSIKKEASHYALTSASSDKLENSEQSAETTINPSSKVAEEAKKAEEARAAEEAKKAEEARAAEEAKKAEEARAAEEAKKAEEARATEEAKKAEEAKAAEEARIAEEARVAEEARIAEEARVAEEARIAEEARVAEEARIAEEARAAEEATAQQRIVYVARWGNANVYWYSLESMPSNTRFDRVVSMTEAEAIAAGKRPSRR